MARRRRSYRRYFHRPRIHRSQSMISKLTSAVALAIGFSDAIEIAATKLPSGDIKGTFNQLAYDYSGGLAFGTFDSQAALKAYGPLVGAVIFKKAASFLLKRARLKF